jgi:hypothetical protein
MAANLLLRASSSPSFQTDLTTSLEEFYLLDLPFTVSLPSFVRGDDILRRHITILRRQITMLRHSYYYAETLYLIWSIFIYEAIHKAYLCTVFYTN